MIKGKYLSKAKHGVFMAENLPASDRFALHTYLTADGKAPMVDTGYFKASPTFGGYRTRGARVPDHFEVYYL